MAARRILVMLAVLMAITALSVAVAPPPRTREEPSSPPGVGEREAPDGAGRTIVRTISADAPEAATVTVPLGATLRLTVEAQTLDAVEIAQLDRSAGVSPDLPAEFELYLDRAGTYDVRLVETGRIVGRVEVSPQR